MQYSVQNPKNRLKIGAVLKLVTLEKSSGVIDLKICHKTKWKPLSPNDFNVYAYPELRLGYSDEYEGDLLTNNDSSLNEMIIDDKEQMNINDFSNDSSENLSSTLINDYQKNDLMVERNQQHYIDENNVIHDEKYIERLHKEIDKRARIEFNNGMGEATNNSELKNILTNLNNNVEKPLIDINPDNLVIVEKIQQPKVEEIANPVIIEKLADEKVHSYDNNNLGDAIIAKQNAVVDKPNTNSEVKFTIKLDKNEQNKYYTNVLDAINKIFDEESDKPFKTMTDIVDEILSQDDKHNKKN